MLLSIRRLNLCAAHVRSFAGLERLSMTLLTKRRRVKPHEVDKDPDKDKLIMALDRREKDLAKLDNDFKCVTLEEKLEKYKVKEDGTVISSFETYNGKKREFKDLETYKRFAQNKISRHLNRLKHRLTPMQLYVTQDCGNEKPFTGLTWSSKAMGVSDHRYEVDNGLLNFWAPIADSVAYRTDKLQDIVATQSYIPDLCRKAKPLKRAICSCCGAHLGYVYDDGPYPFYKRFTVNCAALNLKLKKFWPRPKKPDNVSRMYRKEVQRLVQEKRKNDAKLEQMFKLVNVDAPSI